MSGGGGQWETATAEETALLHSLSSFSAQPRFYFCHRFHVTVLGKVLSIAFALVYAGLFGAVVYLGNVVAVMFALIIFASVGLSTIYGAFKGSKLCLIPFLFLQVMLLVYVFAMVFLLLIIMLNEENQLSVIFEELRPQNLPSRRVMIGTAISLLSCTFPFVFSIYVICLDFEFISEIDEALAHFRELHGGGGNSKESP